MLSALIENLRCISNALKELLARLLSGAYVASLFNHPARAWMLFIGSYIGIYVSHIRLGTVQHCHRR